MSVFANGREVSGKAQPNKVIAGFPSVCLSPPSPPAGPIPIPYPMFTDASKTSAGTGSVRIKKKEVGKKNASNYKSSKGNEPATRTFGMDVVSHTISGASQHEAYSFDVMVEKSGAERFMDITTTNHASPATATTINAAALDPAMIKDPENPCADLAKANKDTRDEMKQHPKEDVKTVANGNTTLTHSYFTPANGGPASIVRASSRKVMCQYDGFVEGLTPEEKEKQRVKEGEQPMESKVCGGHVYKRGFFMPHSSHTEARILEQLTKTVEPGPGGKMGKLVFGIDWPGGGKEENRMKGLSPKSPCEECQALICAALECFDIFVCNEDDEPVDQSEECDE